MVGYEDPSLSASFDKNSITKMKRMKLDSDQHVSPQKNMATLSYVKQSADYDNEVEENMQKGTPHSSQQWPTIVAHVLSFLRKVTQLYPFTL